MTLEFQKDTPQEIRQMITESIFWLDGTDTRRILLAARMEVLYMRGVLHGVQEATDRAVKTIESIGKAKNPSFGQVQS